MFGQLREALEKGKIVLLVAAEISAPSSLALARAALAVALPLLGAFPHYLEPSGRRVWIWRSLPIHKPPRPGGVGCKDQLVVP